MSFTQVSNALGTIVPAKADDRDGPPPRRARAGRRRAGGRRTCPSTCRPSTATSYVFSGHKIFAPTGIGAVFGKTELLETMPPWQGGGNMIEDVTFEKTLYQPPPARFEAGTGNIADAVGLGAALDYLARVGLENIARYEHELLVYATEKLTRCPGCTLIGTAREKAGVLSFVLDGMQTEEVGGPLDQEGIAVRSGHHCAQPILRRFGLEKTSAPRWPPTTPARTSTRWSPRCGVSRRGEAIAVDPRTIPLAALCQHDLRSGDGLPDMTLHVIRHMNEQSRYCRRQLFPAHEPNLIQTRWAESSDPHRTALQRRVQF